MEEGQNFFDFLLAMIPSQIPPGFDAPNLTAANGDGRHVLSVIRGIPTGLYSRRVTFSPAHSRSVHFFCFVRIGGYADPQSPPRQDVGMHIPFLTRPLERARPLVLLRSHGSAGERAYRWNTRGV
jgi:hypothetical protein